MIRISITEIRITASDNAKAITIKILLIGPDPTQIGMKNMTTQNPVETFVMEPVDPRIATRIPIVETTMPMKNNIIPRRRILFK
ncbi:MAG: hypothetical protein JHC12_03315 [Thermogladius sp.]|nr:hypothetical protein [Thermogladius sp.]